MEQSKLRWKLPAALLFAALAFFTSIQPCAASEYLSGTTSGLLYSAEWELEEEGNDTFEAIEAHAEEVAAQQEAAEELQNFKQESPLRKWWDTHRVRCELQNSI